MHADDDACACTHGLCGHHRKVCTGTWLGEKSLAMLGTRTHASVAPGFFSRMLYHLSCPWSSDTLATPAGLVHGVSDTDYWAQNGCTHNHIFVTFKHLFFLLQTGPQTKWRITVCILFRCISHLNEPLVCWNVAEKTLNTFLFIVTLNCINVLHVLALLLIFWWALTFFHFMKFILLLEVDHFYWTFFLLATLEWVFNRHNLLTSVVLFFLFSIG